MHNLTLNNATSFGKPLACIHINCGHFQNLYIIEKYKYGQICTIRSGSLAGDPLRRMSHKTCTNKALSCVACVRPD